MSTPCRLLFPLLLAAPFAAQAGDVHLGGLQDTNRQFIVKLRPTTYAATPPRIQDVLARTMPQKRAMTPQLSALRQMYGGAYVVRHASDLSRANAELIMRQLAADPDVASVEADPMIRARYYAGKDPWWGFQQNFHGQYGTDATAAWHRTMGDGVNVAVLDTGQCSHPDLNARLLPGFDAIDRDTNANIACGAAGSHGSIVASAIAAVPDNGIGMVGTAPNARVVPVRVLHDDGGGFLSTAIEGIHWARGANVGAVAGNTRPVKAINLSLGGSGWCIPSLQDAVDKATASGITVVTAAGNEDDAAWKYFPGNCANVVNVGATHEGGTRTSFSNYGDAVHLAAPGWTHWTHTNGNGFWTYWGTSFAAPQVAAIVAMMQSVAAQPLSPAQVKGILVNSTRGFPTPQGEGLGTGIANAPSAVAVAAAQGRPTFSGAFAIAAHYEDSANGSRHAGCLIRGSTGTPLLHYWNAGGGLLTCGQSSTASLLLNKQAVWDIAPVTSSSGITVHVIRNRADGRCLIRSNNGNDWNASLYLWANLANKTWCGLRSADELIANGQAAWLFDAMGSHWRGNFPNFVQTQVGFITQFRPKASWLGFNRLPPAWPGTGGQVVTDTASIPVTEFLNGPAWRFELIAL